MVESFAHSDNADVMRFIVVDEDDTSGGHVRVVHIIYYSWRGHHVAGGASCIDGGSATADKLWDEFRLRPTSHGRQHPTSKCDASHQDVSDRWHDSSIIQAVEYAHLRLARFLRANKKSTEPRGPWRFQVDLTYLPSSPSRLRYIPGNNN